MSDRYVLKDGQPVPEPDLETWARWFETANRTIARTLGKDFVVSTVFLGLDHSFGDGPSILFETMVFPRNQWDARTEGAGNGLSEQETARYSTLKEASEGHVAMCAKWKVSA